MIPGTRNSNGVGEGYLMRRSEEDERRAQKLKRMMEEQWQSPNVAAAYYKAGWRLAMQNDAFEQLYLNKKEKPKHARGRLYK